MRRETDACPIGTRGARSRASQVASIGCPVRARGGVEAKRRGRPWGFPLVGAVSACRAPRDAIAAGVEQQQVVFTRDAASRPAPSTTRSGGRTSSGCVAEASDGARCPFLARSYLGLRRRPAASCGCPAVLKVKRRALGGFSRVLASLFSEPRDEYVHFSKTYL